MVVVNCGVVVVNCGVMVNCGDGGELFSGGWC